jgi:hypothetical protein
MEKAGSFFDFDDETVFRDSQSFALTDSSLNFAVEFGKDKAQIAFGLTSQEVEALLGTERSPETPVRWM